MYPVVADNQVFFCESAKASYSRNFIPGVIVNGAEDLSV